MPTRILSIDTSSALCLVCLRAPGDAAGQEIISESHTGTRQHASQLLPLVDKVLERAQLGLQDLDAIAFACGPGSFTGVRMAACAVQGLAFGTDLPVVAVSSLAVLAQSTMGLLNLPTAASSEERTVLLAMNAYMGEVFAGRFESVAGCYYCVGEEMLLRQDALPQWFEEQSALASKESATTIKRKVVPRKLGDGWELAAMQADEPAIVTAAGLLSQVESTFARSGGVAAVDALPTYLRGADAWQKSSAKTVLKS